MCDECECESNRVCVAWSGTRDDELPESAKPRARQNWEVCGVCRVCEVSITEEQILSEEGYSSRSQIRARRVQYRLRSELEPRRIQQLQPDGLLFPQAARRHR